MKEATKQNDKQTGKVVTLENYHHTYSLQSTLLKKLTTFYTFSQLGYHCHCCTVTLCIISCDVKVPAQPCPVFLCPVHQKSSNQSQTHVVCEEGINLLQGIRV